MLSFPKAAQKRSLTPSSNRRVGSLRPCLGATGNLKMSMTMSSLSLGPIHKVERLQKCLEILKISVFQRGLLNLEQSLQ